MLIIYFAYTVFFFFFNDETIIFFSSLTKFSMQSNAFGCGQFGGFEYSAWELSYGFVHSQVRHIGSVAAVESVAEPVAKHGGGDNFMRATFFFCISKFNFVVIDKNVYCVLVSVMCHN
jgi:hypothetical protein